LDHYQEQSKTRIKSNITQESGDSSRKIKYLERDVGRFERNRNSTRGGFAKFIDHRGSITLKYFIIRFYQGDVNKDKLLT
jgi:hypothetical protein